MPVGTVPIERVEARAYRIPTLTPESDGTFEWRDTTLVVAAITAGGKAGIGYTYSSDAAMNVINSLGKNVLYGLNAFNIPLCCQKMCAAVRNMGRSGIAATAISSLDCALWDLKAKLLDISVATLLGQCREEIPVYGSGGFTTYDPDQVAQQIEDWKELGIWQFKIKIGRDTQMDFQRIERAARFLPKHGSLFVDANGAYSVKEAAKMAVWMAEAGVSWFEEPVTSDNREGLKHMRQSAPPNMDIAAGEYCYNLDDVRLLLQHEAIDVMQIDVTRCLGITGFLKAAALCEAQHIPISSHCAPAQHTALMCSISDARHIEYFFDHSRIEKMLFDGVPEVKNGVLMPQVSAPGFGYIFKTKDAEAYAL
jgi:L-alanine-DL-glutamate epimerase-like enolase superfamily enzyme